MKNYPKRHERHNFVKIKTSFQLIVTITIVVDQYWKKKLNKLLINPLQNIHLTTSLYIPFYRAWGNTLFFYDAGEI